MERNIQRIDGIKMDLASMSTDELRGVQGHLVARHALVTAGIELVETELLGRRQPQLPLEEYPEALGERIETHGMTWERYIEATRDV